jgi:ankyrin repeat protein
MSILEEQDPQKIYQLLQRGADVNEVDELGRNALFTATSTEVVSLLLDAGIKINTIDIYGENALPLF